MLWGGAVRMAALHHVTYSIYSLCHFSATHGLRVWEIDRSALVIRGLEATGLAWDVQRVTREREQERYPRT